MHDPAKSRLDMLERTVLELGTELFNLKGTIVKNQESHLQFLAVIKGLKQLLDDKGLITLDDFDAAVELGEVLERLNAQLEHGAHSEYDKPKKTGH